MQFSINNYSKNAQAKGWGHGWPQNNSKNMVSVKAPRSGKKTNVNRRIGRLCAVLLGEIERLGYPIRMLGGYNNRQIFHHGKPTGVPSNHSWGLAMDLNWDKNPESSDGKVHSDMPVKVRVLMNRYGFAWGGDYRRTGFRDPMHFEFMGSPADADTMTAKAVRELLHKSSPKATTPVRTYTVKTGDTLSGIFKMHPSVGSVERLYKLNVKVIGPDKNLIKPGQVLVLQ